MAAVGTRVQGPNDDDVMKDSEGHPGTNVP